MSAIQVGHDGSTLTLLPGYPQATRNSAGVWQLEYQYWCSSEDAEGLAPAASSAPPGGVHPTLKCREVRISPLAPGRVTMAVLYAAPDASSSSSPAHVSGDVTREVTAGGMREISIDDPQALELFSAAQIATRKAQGYSTIPVSTVEYHYTEYLDDFEWTEANAVADLSGTSDPEGLTAPTSGLWKLTAYTIRQQADLIEKRRTWQYSVAGW